MHKMIGTRQFRFAWLPTVLTLLMVLGMIALGFWQLDRAEQKRVLRAEFNHREALPPFALLGQILDIKTDLYRRASAVGSYDSDHIFLWDNRIHQGRVGYHVISVLHLSDKQALLVDRGWIPLGVSRQELPSVQSPAGEREVTGRLIRPSILPFQGKDNGLESKGSWPRVVQSIHFSPLEKLLGISLQPFMLELDAGLEEGFVRDWSAISLADPTMHEAYALQWFLLAFALLGIYLFFSFRRVESQKDRM